MVREKVIATNERQLGSLGAQTLNAYCHAAVVIMAFRR